MPKPRTELGIKLKEICENVYYQPPASIRLSYPCVIYSLSKIQNTHADDSVYMQNNAYDILVIDKNPDSEIVKIISKFPRAKFDRTYISDNLYHTSFSIYF